MWYGIYHLKSDKIVMDEKYLIHSSSKSNTVSIEMVSSSERECSPGVPVTMTIETPELTRSIMHMETDLVNGESKSRAIAVNF